MRQKSGPEMQPAEEAIRDIRRTLEKLGIPRSSFYRWYGRYQRGGPEGLAGVDAKLESVISVLLSVVKQ